MEDVYWECFFNNAGISGPASKDYANIFVKNKISQAILIHINDSHLKSMGIEAVGDIIRILKYIKDFAQNEKSSKLVKETPGLCVATPVVETKVNPTNKITSLSTYENIPGCEVPVAVRRIVTPEIEGRYKIKPPNSSIQNQLKSGKVSQLLKTEEKMTNVTSSNRTVILTNDSSKLNKSSNPVDSTSVLKRLGESLEKYERLSCDENNNDNYKSEVALENSVVSKKAKLEVADNKTILRRFFHASLSKNSSVKVKKVPAKTIPQSKKSNVFLRLGNQGSEINERSEEDTTSKPLPYIGVFKLPNNKNIKLGGIKVRSGHTTDSIRKVEATSTTSNFQSIRINTNFKSQSIKDRLGHR